MKDFNKLPKSIKKTIRYIKQDATIEQIRDIEKVLKFTITNRLEEIKRT
ncbi:hypothetical protein [Litchfieldia alkalitelluris]|nr:hypothetical protein [Litchfieldia alkalitelluris]